MELMKILIILKNLMDIVFPISIKETLKRILFCVHVESSMETGQN
jgi:hypothetical protein